MSKSPAPLAIEHVAPSKLKAAPYNPRKMSAEARAKLERGIAEFGLVDPIIARRKDRMVIGGHQRLASAIAMGIASVPVVYLDNISDTRAKALNILLNNPNALGEYDDALLTEALRSLADDGFDLSLTAFNPDELDALLHPPGILDGADLDAAPEPPATPITKLGDLIVMGRHRLLCGDSTRADNVARLMDGASADMVFTDPPYGVGYSGGAKKRDKLAGDEVGTTIYADALPHLREAAADHAALYLWYADAHAAAAAAAGYAITAQIIWVKNNAQFVTSAHYKGKHEPCFYAHRKGKTARWVGANNEVTVWEVSRAPKNEYHPTQKPVELAARAIGNSSNPGDKVLDIFAGSGSTLIACEQTGRVNYSLELDAGYCDVIVQRWEKATGQQAVRP